MHLDDRGLIGPGKLADFVVLRDLESFEPEAVFKSGKCVFEEMDAAGVWSGVMGECGAAEGCGAAEAVARRKSVVWRKLWCGGSP